MILVRANRSDEEPWRLERLELLSRILQFHKDVFLEEEARVIKLYDHKGMLAVNWTAKPTESQQHFLNSFWDAVFCEPLVDHFVRGYPITDEGSWSEGEPFR